MCYNVIVDCSTNENLTKSYKEQKMIKVTSSTLCIVDAKTFRSLTDDGLMINTPASISGKKIDLDHIFDASRPIFNVKNTKGDTLACFAYTTVANAIVFEQYIDYKQQP